MNERAVESRRRFLIKTPIRLMGLAAVAPTILAGCNFKESSKITEPKTPAEKEIWEVIQLNRTIEQHPDVPYTAAVTLAQAEIQGQKHQNILDLYDQIKQPYQSIIADYGLAANLAYAAGKYGYTEKRAREIFEVAKSGFTTEVGAPCDIATLTMARGVDISKPYQTFRQIADDDSLKFFGLTSSYDAVSILTSAALISNLDKTLDYYKKIKGTQLYWSSHRTAGTLTLATILANGNVDRVMEEYSTTTRQDFETFLGMRRITENAIALLALTGIITGRLNDNLEMYEFAKKSGFDSNTSTRMVLATAAKSSQLSLISRQDTESNGKITYTDIVPIALGNI